MLTKRRKRPCRFCHRWFYPDARVGDRQRACSSPQCQGKRKVAQQAAWRDNNRDYYTAKVIVKKAAQTQSSPSVLDPPLDRLPRDIAKTQFGAQGAEFIWIFVTLLLKHMKMQIRAQVLDSS